MFYESIKCSTQNNDNNIAYNYCSECDIYMCNNCLKSHLNLFKNHHHLLDLIEDKSQLFNDFCKEDKHLNKIEYYCETHKQLCCLSCIGKDKKIENSKHKNCKVYDLSEIINDKKRKLDQNLKILRELSSNIKEKIDNSNNIYMKLKDIKEDLKTKIRQTMENIRAKINQREDELFSTLETLHNKLCPTEKEMNDYQNIPKQIKEILEKSKDIYKKADNSFLLNSYIDDCINIENYSRDIQLMVDSMNKYIQNSEKKVNYSFKETGINKINNNIKSIGRIYQDEKELENLPISEEEKKIVELKENIKELRKEIEEKNELKEKIKELQKEIDKNKEKNEKKYNQLKREGEDIKNQLDKTMKDNQALRTQIMKSKIRFTIRSRCDPNKCLDTTNLAYGSSPHLWQYGYNNQFQIFELERSLNDTYAIKCSASGLYLGIDKDKITFRRRNENYQSFYINHFGDGYYLFQEMCGAVIDLFFGLTDNGSPIGRSERNNSEAQQWKLVIHL